MDYSEDPKNADALKRLLATNDRQRAAREAQEAQEAAGRATWTPRKVDRELRAYGYERRGCVDPGELATALSAVIRGEAGGALLYGRVGNGKSMAARWMAERHGFAWISAAALTDSWIENKWPLFRWTPPGYGAGRGLIIDDLGRERQGSDFSAGPVDVFMEIFTNRVFESWHEHHRPPLLITANLHADNPIAGLTNRYGARVRSRIFDGLIPVQFNGLDQRTAIHSK